MAKEISASLLNKGNISFLVNKRITFLKIILNMANFNSSRVLLKSVNAKTFYYIFC